MQDRLFRVLSCDTPSEIILLLLLRCLMNQGGAAGLKTCSSNCRNISQWLFSDAADTQLACGENESIYLMSVCRGTLAVIMERDVHKQASQPDNTSSAGLGESTTGSHGMNAYIRLGGGSGELTRIPLGACSSTRFKTTSLLLQAFKGAIISAVKTA